MVNKILLIGIIGILLFVNGCENEMKEIKECKDLFLLDYSKEIDEFKNKSEEINTIACWNERNYELYPWGHYMQSFDCYCYIVQDAIYAYKDYNVRKHTQGITEKIETRKKLVEVYAFNVR